MMTFVSTAQQASLSSATAELLGLNLDTLIEPTHEVSLGFILGDVYARDAFDPHVLEKSAHEILEAVRRGDRERAEILRMTLAIEFGLAERHRRLNEEERQRVKLDLRFAKTPEAIAHIEGILKKEAVKEDLFDLLNKDLNLVPYIGTLGNFDWHVSKRGGALDCTGSDYKGVAYTPTYDDIATWVEVTLTYDAYEEEADHTMFICVKGIDLERTKAFLAEIRAMALQSEAQEIIEQVSSTTFLSEKELEELEVKEIEAGIYNIPMNEHTLHFLELLVSRLKLQRDLPSI